MTAGRGRQRRSRFERRVAERVLQVHDDEEEHASEAGIDRERHEVRAGELAGAEELEREHRRRSVSLDDDERDEEDDTDDDRDDRRCRPLAARLDEPRRERREPEGDRSGAEHVEVTRSGRVEALRHMANGDEHQDAERHVDEERPSPRRGVDQPSPDERPRRAGDAGKTGPRADGARSVGLADGGGEQREAARHQQRGACALHRASSDECSAGGRGAAQRGRDGEADHPDGEHAPAPVAITQRAAEQEERGQGHEVRVEHPLEVGDVRVQVVRHRRERDVHDGGIEERHP